MNKWNSGLATLALVAALPIDGSASSEEAVEHEVDEATPWVFGIGGAYLTSFEGLSDMRVDAQARNYEQNHLWTHRLLISPSFRFASSVEVQMELQLLGGHLTWDDPHELIRRADGETVLTEVDGVQVEQSSGYMNYGDPRSLDGASFRSGEDL